MLLLMPVSLMAEVNVIPQPTRVTEKAGSFVLKPNATIAYNHRNLLPAAAYLQEKLQPATGYSLPVSKGKNADIILSLNPKCQAGAEGIRQRPLVEK